MLYQLITQCFSPTQKPVLSLKNTILDANSSDTPYLNGVLRCQENFSNLERELGMELTNKMNSLPFRGTQEWQEVCERETEREEKER